MTEQELTNPSPPEASPPEDVESREEALEPPAKERELTNLCPAEASPPEDLECCEEAEELSAEEPPHEDPARAAEVLALCEWAGPEEAAKIGQSVQCADTDMGVASWCPVDATCFRVRQINYKPAKTKAPSAPALYDIVGFDLWRANKPAHHIARQMQLPVPAWSGGSPHVPAVIVINLMLPLTVPSMFKDKSATGPMVMAVVTLVMKESTAQALQDLDNATAAVRLLDKYFRKAPEGANRFKLMGKVRNWTAAGLPKSLKNYNGKPVQISKSGKWTRCSTGSDYAELDINLGCWAFLARKGLRSSWGAIGAAVLDFGVVLESREDSTAPENVLGSCTFRNVDVTKKLPEWQEIPAEGAAAESETTWSCAKK